MQGEINAMDEFQYLGSVIASSGRMDVDICRRVAQASKAFGAMRQAVFLDKSLRPSTKRKLYKCFCAVCITICSVEHWTPHRKHARKLHTFHNWSIRTILNTSNRQQWV